MKLPSLNRSLSVSSRHFGFRQNTVCRPSLWLFKGWYILAPEKTPMFVEPSLIRIQHLTKLFSMFCFISWKWRMSLLWYLSYQAFWSEIPSLMFISTVSLVLRGLLVTVLGRELYFPQILFKFSFNDLIERPIELRLVVCWAQNFIVLMLTQMIYFCLLHPRLLCNFS